MLGKTNLLFIAEDEAVELVFKPEYILTSSSSNILKIEYINNMFFVFTDDEKVLYGSNINSLQTLKNINEPVPAKHIIYADGVYYMTNIELTAGKAVILKSRDLSSFEEITIKTGNSSYKYPIHGLFLDSNNRIVMLIEEYLGNTSNSDCTKYILIIDTLEEYNEDSAYFVETEKSRYIYYRTATSTKMAKDRIFTRVYGGSSTSTQGIILTLDGATIYQYNIYHWFALDYFFYRQGYAYGDALYYSFNGVDYKQIVFSNVKDLEIDNVFEYDNNLAMIYSCTENGKTVQKLAVSATPLGLEESVNSGIPVSIDYIMQQDASLYKDGYSYLGCTGGTIIKGQIDNAEVIRPDVVVVKGMAAKEALRQANDYTDEKYKNTTKEVKEIEETTRQYMENAFSATPEGYAELVDTVHGNTVAINAIAEKAELNIKETAMGDNIHLIDSAEGKAVEFALYGKATQNTTSGKNLCEPLLESASSKGVSCTKNADGTYTLNGTCSSDSYANFRIDQSTIDGVDNLKSYNGKYAISIRDSNGNLNPNNLSIRLMQNETYQTFLSSAGTTISTINADNCFIFIFVPAGTVLDNLVVYPQLEENSEVTPWEPYTGGIPSPNPNYPQEIEVAGSGGSVEVKSVGKNLLENTATSQTINGVEFVVNEDKSVTLNGEKQAGATTIILKDRIDLVKGETYLITRGLSSSNGYPMITSDIKKADGTSIGDGFNTETISEYKCVEDGVYLANVRLWLGSSGVTYDNVTIYPMIRKASDTDDTYQPYKETLSTIPTTDFAGIKVDSNGNYTDSNGQQWICDEIVKYADGSGEKIQRIAKVVFDGVNKAFTNKSNSTKSNTFFADSSTPNIKLPSTSKSLPNVLCSCFKGIPIDDGYSNGLIGVYQNTSILNIYFSFGLDTEITTLELANAWLVENPMTLYYALAEPIRTPLTAEEISEIEKLSTFYPVTNISNDGGCGMGITYLADSKNYINRKVAEQVASIVENIK